MSLTGLCVVAALLHLLLLRPTARGWRMRPPNRPPEAPLPPLTVVTAARNEESHLPAWWAALQAQDLAPRAVVVADDRSTDGTAALLRRFQAEDPRLRVVSIPENEAPSPIAANASPDAHPRETGRFFLFCLVKKYRKNIYKTKKNRRIAPKKHALSQAIAAAPTDNLALTDADCRPQTGWLRAVAGAFAGGADLVLGYSPYRPTGRRMLDALIAYETFHAAFLYLGDALRGRAWMGVGRNLAYRRSWFEAQGGFDRHAGRLSGDDDLLVAWAPAGTRVAVLLEPLSWVWSEPPAGWRAWWRQKRRHVSASGAYPPGLKLRLGALGLTQVVVWGLGLWALGQALVQMNLPVRSILIFVCYLKGKHTLMAPAGGLLTQGRGLIRLAGAELLLALYHAVVVPTGWLRVAHWK